MIPDDWFVKEILPHEKSLVRWLNRVWPNAADTLDLRHDIYIRIMESAAKVRPTSPKSFLFSTARHLLVDRARRNRIVSIDLLEDLDSLNVMIDELSPERQVSARQQLLRLSEVFNLLPTRCREVVWMRKVEDVSQKEIACRLGIAEATVEKHLVRGVKMLAELFHGGKDLKGMQDSERSSDYEFNHGQ